MALGIPTKPKEFRPDWPPPGYRTLYVNFAATRKIITPRIQLIHTNGAANPGSIEASKSWAERRTYNGTTTTLPTFQVDLDGDAAMFININQAQNACFKVNPWAISYETADTGYKTDPSISAFTEAQLQALANGCAYCSVLFKIPLAYPAAWDGAGTASHTEPFGYPYWTNSNGKICPGQKKKAQVRDIILPHARKIVEAWQGTVPAPPVPPPTDWRTVGKSYPTPPATMQRYNVYANTMWLQAVLCSMDKLAADGGGPIYNPQWVGYDSKAGVGGESGFYADQTYNAVAYWQSKNGLTVDGVYNSATASKMAGVRGK